MPRRVAVSTLNATTMDILNVIRQNASYDYQQNVPEVTKTTDILIVPTPGYTSAKTAKVGSNTIVVDIASFKADMDKYLSWMALNGQN